MPVDRPTFSESWYRVATLRPRLRSTVQIHRQQFRGRLWQVAQDPSSNQFFRMNEVAYHFIGLLDGRRTVAEAWKICSEQQGDEAPTQNEAIQLLGQLYVSNLLQAELPPDAVGLFRRHSKRVGREVKGYVSNFMFMRFPLYDPDHFLNRWVGVFGRLFTWYGLILWAAIVGTGAYFLVGRGDDLVNESQDLFKNTENLLWLYLAMAIIKVFHEFGHAFACKRFGRISGTGGEVHVMGIMLLVFTPLPYVDASSAWAFRKKSHRVIVGAAGILVELAVAAVAAVIWSRTSEGVLHSVMYNMMFIASVSTLLFNGNPLLRFDGYYILSDLIAIPNLAQRSKMYLHYLVKRYVWGVRRARSPAHTPGERRWFFFYGIASTVYRVFICVRILTFVAGRFFFMGVVLAAAAVFAWVLTPLGKFVHYLAVSPELSRVRFRAAASTIVVLGGVVVGVGVIPMAHHYRLEGVVEPVHLQVIRAGQDGFLRSFLPTDQQVRPGQDSPLLRMESEDLADELTGRQATYRRIKVYKQMALDEKAHDKLIPLRQYLSAADEQIQTLLDRQARLIRRPEQPGVWIAPRIERLEGAFLRKGDTLGMVASPDKVLIRAVAQQHLALALLGEIEGRPDAPARRVEIRFRRLPRPQFSGTVAKILPAGQEQLPSEALGYAVGGSVRTAAGDRKGTKAAEPFFEVHILPGPDAPARIRSGQRVVVRLSLASKPLAAQWWRSLLQLLQSRFGL